MFKEIKWEANIKKKSYRKNDILCTIHLEKRNWVKVIQI